MKEGLTLDHYCGPCRVSISLSTYTPVVGLDLSMYLLQAAKKRAKQAGVKNLYLIRANMRHLSFQPEIFDNTINIWTSFGFFSEEENETVLKEITRVLQDEGVYDLQELEELLSNESMEITQVYGTLRKESFDETKSKRMITLSKKSTR